MLLMLLTERRRCQLPCSAKALLCIAWQAVLCSVPHLEFKLGGTSRRQQQQQHSRQHKLAAPATTLKCLGWFRVPYAGTALL